MAKRRPQKIYRLNYFSSEPKLGAQISILGDPAEIRIAATPKSFIGVSEDGITLSAGPGKPINVQAMSSNFKYGGMLQALPFPLSLLPSTTYTPFPKQIIVPPLKPLIQTLVQLGELVSLMV
jgi:hypothetical protein